MKAFFDNIAHGFETIGMHPVLGAFVTGVVIAVVFMRTGSRDAASPAEHGLHTGATPAGVDIRNNVSDANNISPTLNGRSIDLPPELKTMLQAGNKLDAIKAVRIVRALVAKAPKT